MKLVEIMSESLIFPEVQAADKSEALHLLTSGIAEKFPDIHEAELYSVIMERERLSSTGIGSGIAIPHAKLQKTAHHIAAFGRSRQGIPFDAIDGKPVHLVFLLVGPSNANEAHLKALARISKFLHDTNFRDQLLTVDSAKDIYEAIAAKDAQF